MSTSGGPWTFQPLTSAKPRIVNTPSAGYEGAASQVPTDVVDSDIRRD